MPAMGDAKGPDGSAMLTTADLWALVHYVRSLSDPDLAARGEE